MNNKSTIYLSQDNQHRIKRLCIFSALSHHEARPRMLGQKMREALDLEKKQLLMATDHMVNIPEIVETKETP